MHGQPTKLTEWAGQLLLHSAGGMGDSILPDQVTPRYIAEIGMAHCIDPYYYFY